MNCEIKTARTDGVTPCKRRAETRLHYWWRGSQFHGSVCLFHALAFRRAVWPRALGGWRDGGR